MEKAIPSSALNRFFARAGHVWVGTYALSTAFVAYFCMYAFRKPFAVATYDGMASGIDGIDFKTAIVIAQAVGYAASKLIGIKIVSEADTRMRPWLIVSFIAASLASLMLFALVPPPFKILMIFFSGLPLGMIWGLVFGYLEGRRLSEILGAGLCVSFIVSSGVVKSVGRLLIVDCGVPELWMPALTGALFLPLLGLSVWLLAQTPPPDEADRAERMARTPMFKAERRSFFKAAWPGLVALIAAYVMLTALRDFRDNFAVEIWQALGFADAPAIFALSELPIAALILPLFGATVLIRDNRHAVFTYHVLIIAGALGAAVATFAFQIGLIDPVWWMIAVGAGIYVGYVPFNAVLVDRMTAALAVPGNAAFFLYLADTSGYVGSLGILLFKCFGGLHLSWLRFFIDLSYVGTGVIAAATLASLLYFRFRPPHKALYRKVETGFLV
jgi:hypothetical protein